jgi:hypothetical protein
MIQRGRKSLEDNLVVIQGSGGAKPEPPEDLNDRQKQIWRETTACEPADLINTAATRAMLVDYCRHREAGENVSKIIDSFKPEWIKNEDGAKRYHDLLKMRELETKAAVRVATKLRLTNQSRYRADGTGVTNTTRNAVQGLRPWEA